MSKQLVKGGSKQTRTSTEGPEVLEVAPVPALQARYRDKVVDAFLSAGGCTNRLAMPRLLKVCLNMGLGKALVEKKLWDQALDDLARISGQRAVRTKARKAVSNFKTRVGWDVGARVTLRGRNMYEFLYRLLFIALPRVPDFRGLNPRSFDGRGNYSMGLGELLVFPEIDPDKSTVPLGVHITVVTSARTDAEGRRLLKELGFPFKRES